MADRPERRKHRDDSGDAPGKDLGSEIHRKLSEASEHPTEQEKEAQERPDRRHLDEEVHRKLSEASRRDERINQPTETTRTGGIDTEPEHSIAQTEERRLPENPDVESLQEKGTTPNQLARDGESQTAPEAQVDKTHEPQVERSDFKPLQSNNIPHESKTKLEGKESALEHPPEQETTVRDKSSHGYLTEDAHEKPSETIQLREEVKQPSDITRTDGIETKPERSIERTDLTGRRSPDKPEELPFQEKGTTPGLLVKTEERQTNQETQLEKGKKLLVEYINDAKELPQTDLELKHKETKFHEQLATEPLKPTEDSCRPAERLEPRVGKDNQRRPKESHQRQLIDVARRDDYARLEPERHPGDAVRKRTDGPIVLPAGHFERTIPEFRRRQDNLLECANEVKAGKLAGVLDEIGENRKEVAERPVYVDVKETIWRQAINQAVQDSNLEALLKNYEDLGKLKSYYQNDELSLILKGKTKEGRNIALELPTSLIDAMIAEEGPLQVQLIDPTIVQKYDFYKDFHKTERTFIYVPDYIMDKFQAHREVIVKIEQLPIWYFVSKIEGKASEVIKFKEIKYNDNPSIPVLVADLGGKEIPIKSFDYDYLRGKGPSIGGTVYVEFQVKDIFRETRFRLYDNGFNEPRFAIEKGNCFHSIENLKYFPKRDLVAVEYDNYNKKSTTPLTFKEFPHEIDLYAQRVPKDMYIVGCPILMADSRSARDSKNFAMK